MLVAWSYYSMYKQNIELYLQFLLQFLVNSPILLFLRRTDHLVGWLKYLLIDVGMCWKRIVAITLSRCPSSTISTTSITYKQYPFTWYLFKLKPGCLSDNYWYPPTPPPPPKVVNWTGFVKKNSFFSLRKSTEKKLSYILLSTVTHFTHLYQDLMKLWSSVMRLQWLQSDPPPPPNWTGFARKKIHFFHSENQLKKKI